VPIISFEIGIPVRRCFPAGLKGGLIFAEYVLFSNISLPGTVKAPSFFFEALLSGVKNHLAAGTGNLQARPNEPVRLSGPVPLEPKNYVNFLDEQAQIA